MKKLVLILVSVLVVIILLFLVVSAVAAAMFNSKVNNEIHEFLRSQETVEPTRIEASDLEHLPQSVQKWLRASGVIGNERIQTVRTKQSALVRLDKDTDQWMPLTADQYNTVVTPGFLWKAKFKAAPFVHIAGRDMYHDGKGHMLIKFQSLFHIANAKGFEIDQGSLVRYLAEIVWLPTAALEEYITWEEIDGNTALATMTYKGVSASGIFTFDEQGNAIHFIADRYGDFDGEFIMKPWSITIHDHQVLHGFTIPMKAEITWKLDTGDYTWFQLEVQDIEYNIVKPE